MQVLTWWDTYEAEDDNDTTTTFKVSETIVDASEVSTSKQDSNDCRTKTCDDLLVLRQRQVHQG